MREYGSAFGIGFVAGLRTMSACAALSWAASRGRTRSAAIPSGPLARAVATTAAWAEMAGDKMPFAPDRRIPPSFAARLAVGAVGGWMFTGRQASAEAGALAGAAGAVAGTLLGRLARGAGPGAPFGLARGLAEDAAAASLAAALAASAQRQRVRPVSRAGLPLPEEPAAPARIVRLIRDTAA